MKTINIKQIILVVIATTLVVSCKQDVVTLTEQTVSPPTGNKGSLDFSKYISIGNSLTAGFQAGALFTEGQNNSFPLILSKQFSIAQGTALTFNQPDINSVNGYNSSASAAAGITLGRYFLFASDGVQADAIPTPAGLPGLPSPYNTNVGPAFTDAAFYNYTGDKSKLNNFGAPGIILAQCLIPDTGNPSSPYYNPYYGRFASNPGTSTIIGDAIATQPTFFTFDLGNNDVLGYAISGGDGSVPITDNGSFSTYYQNAVGALLTNTSANGVLTTIPDVTSIPYFLAVSWNAIPLDANTAAGVKANLADNYNAFLDGMGPNGYAVITQAEVDKRKLTYQAGQNAILINDETLTDLSPYMTGPYAGLAPYHIARQTTSADLVTLSAGAVLGTLANPNDASTVYGVAVPMDDKYILIKEEVDSIKTATTGFNTIINSMATANSSRLVVADVNLAFNTLLVQYVTTGYVFDQADNVSLDPTFAPPFGVFSEDGVHPNSRGYAYLANIIIDAINAKTAWGATIPKANLGAYAATGLPYGPNGIIQ